MITRVEGVWIMVWAFWMYRIFALFRLQKRKRIRNRSFVKWRNERSPCDPLKPSETFQQHLNTTLLNAWHCKIYRRCHAYSSCSGSDIPHVDVVVAATSEQVLGWVKICESQAVRFSEGNTFELLTKSENKEMFSHYVLYRKIMRFY